MTNGELIKQLEALDPEETFETWVRYGPEFTKEGRGAVEFQIAETHIVFLKSGDKEVELQ